MSNPFFSNEGLEQELLETTKAQLQHDIESCEELTETEAEAVSGGLNIGLSASDVTQTNVRLNLGLSADDSPTQANARISFPFGF